MDDIYCVKKIELKMWYVICNVINLNESRIKFKKKVGLHLFSVNVLLETTFINANAYIHSDVYIFNTKQLL